MNYHVVFDIADKSTYWWLPIIGLVAAVVSIVILVGLITNKIKSRLFQTRQQAVILSVVISVFSLILSVSSGLFIYYQHQRILSLIRQEQVVEGRVENFAPMPYEGKALESFTVDGIKFEYSDFVLSPGFNNTASHGGPIREGLQVRIHYVDNVILKLEIKTQ